MDDEEGVADDLGTAKAKAAATNPSRGASSASVPTQDLPQRVAKQVDLTKYPTSFQPIEPGVELTIGDLHGNSIKFLFFLITEGVATLSPTADYDELLKIYQKDPHSLIEKDLTRFQEILDNATFNQGVGKIRLMGDEMADRGMNDYFTLLILKKLKTKNIPVEIIDSNHGDDFLQFYTEGCKSDFQSPLETTVLGQARSLVGLTTLLKNNIVTEAKVKELIEDAYIPTTKLLSYSIARYADGPKITIFTHAPVGLETIEALAAKYGIEYKDDSVESLANTIDQINSAFQIGDKSIKDRNDPLNMIRWNRYSDGKVIKRPAQKNGFNLGYVHGHDGDCVPDAENNPHVTNLNNLLGYKEKYAGSYSIHVGLSTVPAAQQTAQAGAQAGMQWPPPALKYITLAPAPLPRNNPNPQASQQAASSRPLNLAPTTTTTTPTAAPVAAPTTAAATTTTANNTTTPATTVAAAAQTATKTPGAFEISNEQWKAAFSHTPAALDSDDSWLDTDDLPHKLTDNLDSLRANTETDDIIAYYVEDDDEEDDDIKVTTTSELGIVSNTDALIKEIQETLQSQEYLRFPDASYLHLYLKTEDPYVEKTGRASIQQEVKLLAACFPNATRDNIMKEFDSLREYKASNDFHRTLHNNMLIIKDQLQKQIDPKTPNKPLNFDAAATKKDFQSKDTATRTFKTIFSPCCARQKIEKLQTVARSIYKSNTNKNLTLQKKFESFRDLGLLETNDVQTVETYISRLQTNEEKTIAMRVFVDQMEIAVNAKIAEIRKAQDDAHDAAMRLRNAQPNPMPAIDDLLDDDDADATALITNAKPNPKSNATPTPANQMTALTAKLQNATNTLDRQQMTAVPGGRPTNLRGSADAGVTRLRGVGDTTTPGYNQQQAAAAKTTADTNVTDPADIRTLEEIKEALEGAIETLNLKTNNNPKTEWTVTEQKIKKCLEIKQGREVMATVKKGKDNITEYSMPYGKSDQNTLKIIFKASPELAFILSSTSMGDIKTILEAAKAEGKKIRLSESTVEFIDKQKATPANKNACEAIEKLSQEVAPPEPEAKRKKLDT